MGEKFEGGEYLCKDLYTFGQLHCYSNHNHVKPLYAYMHKGLMAGRSGHVFLKPEAAEDLLRPLCNISRHTTAVTFDT